MAEGISRRQALRIGAAAVGVTAVGVPVGVWAPQASAYPVPPRMDWWYAARFGMFIHFGSYSFAGRGEWLFSNEGWAKANYQTQISANFNPTRFSAADIVGYAKSAGMKYLVITSKHHEGFAMWDSRVASFKDTTGTKQYTLPGYTPYKADLLGALKAECDRQGLRFGLYYSILDWSHPSQTIRHTDTTFSTMASSSARTSYINDMKAQLTELLTRYDPAILWFDGDWCADRAAPTLADWWIKADGQSLQSFLIGLKPNLIVNERVKRDLGLGDFESPEQQVPATPRARPWETNQTMNGAWGYDASRENSYKSAKTLIQELSTVVSRDGNYLLNIGPKGDGTVSASAISLLSTIGVWTRVYGDAVYGTTASPFATEPSWGRFTKKNGSLYAHVFTWPTNGTLAIPALQNTISRIYLLNNPGTSLAYTVGGGTINVTVPASAPDPNVSVVVVEVTGLPAPAGNPSPGIVSGGVYRLINQQSGMALDNANSTTDGTAVIQWTDNGGVQKEWTVTAVGGAHKLVSRHSGKALDNASSTTDGAAVAQWTDNGGDQQQWTLTDVGGGVYTVVSRRSGKALDSGGSTTAGSTVVQRTGTGAAAQTWRFVRVGP